MQAVVVSQYLDCLQDKREDISFKANKGWFSVIFCVLLFVLQIKVMIPCFLKQISAELCTL